MAVQKVTINSLKNKSKDDCLPAKNVKKARKAEVNYCPSNPAGETDESLEKLRVELLNDVEQRDRTQLVKEMSRTFAFRRKEVVHGTPSAAEFKARWPALFCAGEVGTCFFKFYFLSPLYLLVYNLGFHLFRHFIKLIVSMT